jgi:hypothetical protein
MARVWIQGNSFAASLFAAERRAWVKKKNQLDGTTMYWHLWTWKQVFAYGDEYFSPQFLFHIDELQC